MALRLFTSSLFTLLSICLFLAGGLLVFAGLKTAVDVSNIHQVTVWFVALGLVLSYVGYRSIQKAINVYRGVVETHPDVFTDRPPVHSSGFRYLRGILSLLTITLTLLSLFACRVLTCSYPIASSGQASLIRVGVLMGFALALLFAAQAVSGLNVRGLIGHWRSVGIKRQLLIGLVVLALFFILSYLAGLAFKSIGIYFGGS
jgi:hypothetical protein